MKRLLLLCLTAAVLSSVLAILLPAVRRGEVYVPNAAAIPFDVALAQEAPVAPVAPAPPVTPVAPVAPKPGTDVEQLKSQVETLQRQLEEARSRLEEMKVDVPAAPAPAPAAPEIRTSGLQLRGQNYTVQANEVVDGDVRLMGGNLTILGRVSGDVSTTGGNLAIRGFVGGNAATLGGNVTLGESAVVNGDVQVMGGNVERAPGSQVHGNIRVNSGVSGPFAAVGHAPNMAAALIATPMNLPMAFLLFFVGTVLLVAWPRRMDTVGQAFVNRPVHSFLVGLTSVPVFLLICATIVGLFFAPIVWLSAFIMGVCAMALMLGRRLAVGRPYRSRIFPLIVGLGAWFLAMVFSSILGPLYPVMVIATVLAYVTALGATFSTGFGKSPLWLRDRLQGRRRDPFAIDPSETYAGR